MKDFFSKIISWLIVAYLFLLPWQTAYIFDEAFVGGAKSQFLTGQIYATELLLWLIIIIYIISNFRFSIFKNIPAFSFSLKNDKQMFMIALWLFLAWSGLSIAWAPSHWAAYYLWLHFLEAGALLLVIANSNISRLRIFWALMLSSALQGLLAFWQFVSQSVAPNKWLGMAGHSAGTLGDIVIEASSGRWLRAYGAFSHPNVLGGFLILGLICGFMLWQKYYRPAGGKDALKSLLIIVSVILSATGLFFSFSRSAGVALAVVCLLSIPTAAKFLQLKSRGEKILFMIMPLGLALTFAVFFFIFNPLVLARLDQSNRLEARSQSERIGQLAEAQSIISSAPMAGVGLNNYTVELSRRYLSRPAYELMPAHNIFLLLWSELGIIGLASFIYLIIICFILLREKNGILLSACPLIAFLIIGLFDHYLVSQYAGITMLFLGLTFCLIDDNFQAQKATEP